MRWTRGGRREQPTGELPPAPSYWADRLAALGQALDATGMTMRDISVSVTGEETWLCGWVWWAGRLRSGWAVLALRLEGGRLVSVVPDAPPLERPVGENARPPWAPRLRAVGLLLDRSAAQLHDPWLIEVGGGFVVTVLTTMDGDRGSRIPLSREFAVPDLEAALIVERTSRQETTG